MHQQFVFQYVPIKSCFNSNLCKVFLSANIPFNKLSNPDFKHFLEKVYQTNQLYEKDTLKTRIKKQ